MSESKNSLFNIFKKILSEQKEYTNFDSVWNYKLENNRWYTRKKAKPDGRWIDIMHLPVAVKKLNAKYGTTVSKVKPKIKPIDPNHIKEPDVKADQTNVPRQPRPEYKFKKDKDNKPSDTIVSDLVSPKFKGRINIDKLPSNKESNAICWPGTLECSQFVNDYSDAISNVGNAWLAHDTDNVGTRVFSVYFGLNTSITNYYYNIYRWLKNGKTDKNTINTEIKKLQSAILKSKPQPTDLKVDDVVGIYWEPSRHHIEAFIESAKYGRGYYPNDRKGRALIGGRGHSFNTHVGIVGAIKDGVPLIFHNVRGNVKSTPASKLPIVWVKRNA